MEIYYTKEIQTRLIAEPCEVVSAVERRQNVAEEDGKDDDAAPHVDVADDKSQRHRAVNLEVKVVLKYLWDLIGPFLIVLLATNIIKMQYKHLMTFGDNFEKYLLSKNYNGIILVNVGTNWATFNFNIWSHWS